MIVSRETLLKEAGVSGFPPETLEKVLYLLRLLDAIRRHPYLKDRLVLKGGTALNLFEFDSPRLSVDIDLNYIGTADVEGMKADRPRVEQALADVCNREGLTVERRAVEHAGGKWQIRYASALGGGGNLQVDINFMLRLPLWPVVLRDSRKIGTFQVQQIPLLDINELAAAKLAALLSRHTARGLYRLLTQADLDNAKLRLAFLVYEGMNIEDWRKVSVEHIAFDLEELKQNLIPILRGEAATMFEDGREWSERLVQETRESLSRVPPFTEGEAQFLEALLERAEIHRERLTYDAAMIAKIKDQPMLHWKALNVKKFKGL